MYFPLFVGVLCLSLFCYALLGVYFSFAIILKMKRKLVALLFLSYICIVTINVLWLFLMMQRVGLLYVIVVCPVSYSFTILEIKKVTDSHIYIYPYAFMYNIHTQTYMNTHTLTLPISIPLFCDTFPLLCLTLF